MTPWNQLSELDQYRNTYSQLHKDVTGYRPDYEEVDSWDLLTIKEKISGLQKWVDETN
jgi:hypothetical protein